MKTNTRASGFSAVAAAALCLLIVTPSYAQVGGSPESIVFLSTDSSQWSTTGRVTLVSSDTTLGFLFDFDAGHPPLAIPDTVYLDVLQEIDLHNCSSAFIRFSRADQLPNEQSWVAARVRIYGRHENNPNWFQVFEDITDLAGRVSRLNLRFKVAVRTSQRYPGAFLLDDIRVVGNCRL